VKITPGATQLGGRVAEPRPRIRIDRLLVERGLFESRAKAAAAIAAGQVRVHGVPVTKASVALAPDAVLSAEPAYPYVSRGGVKLAAALDHFRFNAAGRVCLDVGASTGGFTDVLLARGARLIYAVDVGHAQLHPSLQSEPKVVSMERTDVRRLNPAYLPELPDLICIDVSFISLARVLAPALALARVPAQLVGLIKPQFEAGQRALKKGIVRDSAVHALVCESISARVEALGWRVLGIIPSPIPGGGGNREFLLGAARE